MFNYDANGNRTWISLGRDSTRFRYNTDGTVAKIFDSVNPQGDTLMYNVRGNLESLTYRRSEAPTLAAFSMYYDPYGNITQTVDPNGLTTQTFFTQMNRDTMSQQFTSGMLPNMRRVRQSFDAEGNLTRFESPDPSVFVTYRYDELGRRVARQAYGANCLYTYFYDAA